MDERTLNHYDRNAARVAGHYRATPSRMTAYFQQAFPRQGLKILDVGAGSGRDMAALLDRGYDVYGIEPSEGMRSEAIGAYPKLKDRLFPFGLPLPENASVGTPYDGVLCAAVFMHVPPEQLSDAAFSIRRLLKHGGRLLLSVPETRPGLDENHRDEFGRLFHPLPSGDLTLLFERLGFVLHEQWSDEDGAGRPGVRWRTLLFKRQGREAFLVPEAVRTAFPDVRSRSGAG